MTNGLQEMIWQDCKKLLNIYVFVQYILLNIQNVHLMHNYCFIFDYIKVINVKRVNINFVFLNYITVEYLFKKVTGKYMISKSPITSKTQNTAFSVTGGDATLDDEYLGSPTSLIPEHTYSQAFNRRTAKMIHSN